MTQEERTISQIVEDDNPMKEWLVTYVGNQHNPEDDKVTVEMIIESMAKEFPEFVLALAEENWIRGYQQALSDVTEGEKLYREPSLKTPSSRTTATSPKRVIRWLKRKLLN